MVKLGIDFEFESRLWWESGGQELWEGVAESPDAPKVVLDDDLAASWMLQAAQIDGWSDGPEYAPHPVRATTLAEDEPDL
jgi:hypothetical protein